ncbi:hypothetical protein KAU11_06520 [Candidatus Babeliales bacterium]|nr:hypothetical protein [Candidatus Babeliales bacterium]
MMGKNMVELLKTPDGATTGLIIKINVGDLFFLDPNATHVQVTRHPTENGIDLKIRGAEVIP